MFYSDLKRFSDSIALVDAQVQQDGSITSQKVTYRSLAQQIQEFSSELVQSLQVNEPQQRAIAVLKFHPNCRSVVDYLSLLNAGVIVIAVDPAITEKRLTSLFNMYNVNAIVELGQIVVRHRKAISADPNLALLLSTSGSTGAPKHVALSYKNLHANADSISQYLPIEPTDFAMNTLPLYYSFGLSVLNSHLMVGAAIVFSPYTVMDREFWTVLKDWPISSFAGVPYTYTMLDKLRFTRQSLPALRYFTQAGGKLNSGLVESFGTYAQQHGKSFYVMYGQTEATARMAYMQPEVLTQKPTHIGQPIPNGEFKLEDGELYYRGPNVMLGYSESMTDLDSFQPIEWLATGDLAECDSEGNYKIVGRKSRFIKVTGLRLDLESIETELKSQGYEVMCTGDDDRLIVGWVSASSGNYAASSKEITRWVQQHCRIHPSMLTIVEIDSILMTANHKPDYPALKRAADSKIS